MVKFYDWEEARQIADKAQADYESARAKEEVANEEAKVTADIARAAESAADAAWRRMRRAELDAQYAAVPKPDLLEICKSLLHIIESLPIEEQVSHLTAIEQAQAIIMKAAGT